MAESSFDIVSKIDRQEVDNAVNQVKKEISTRYDFKGTKSSIELKEKEIFLIGDDDYKLKALMSILEDKFIKRKISLKTLDYGKIEDGSNMSKKMQIQLRAGIEKENAKQITKGIKSSKLKVNASIQGDQIRVSGKSKDALQEAMALVKELPIELPLQFVNYR